MKFFVLFSLLFSFCCGIHADALTATEYGPSLELLFSGFGSSDIKKEIHLEASYPKYSVVIPLANGKATASPRDVHPEGMFTITAPNNYGIMMVIQNLRLRTNLVYSNRENATIVQCRDYIKVEGINENAEICGFVSKFNRDIQPYGLKGPRTILTGDSQLNITVHVVNSEQMDLVREELISVELVFTAFQDCPDSLISHWHKLTGKSKTKSCSPSDNQVCISAKAFCDSALACGNPGPLGTIGYDEDNCRQSIPVTTEGPWSFMPAPTTTQKSYIGVSTPYHPPTSHYKLNPLEIIGIFVGVVLLLFGTCTWLARANEKKFQHTVYRFSTLRRSRRHVRHNTSQDDLESTRVPTAPPPSETNTLATASISTAPTAPGIPTEPAPPPYHALFPVLPTETISDNRNGTRV